MRRLPLLALLIALGLSFSGSRALAHCQLPCGVFDDAARITMMKEDVTTIAKCMTVINAAETPMNQSVRAINVKDEHADKIAQIVTYYFMAQRIKPDTADYDKKLETLHGILVAAMKAKQSTDTANCAKLTELIDQFAGLYLGEAAHAH